MRNYECAGIGDYTVAISIPISAEKMGRVIVPISPDCLLPPVPAGNCAYLESSSDLGSFCTSPPPGNEIVYTGHGGRDENTGQQKANQTFTRGNAALARNEVLGLPVRVVRGFEPDSPFAPEQGYRYDGLYSVDEFWEETGLSGFKVWRYRLRKQTQSSKPALKSGEEDPVSPERRQVTITRLVRDTEKSRRIKRLYEYACQVCGIRLDTPAGPYAEGAHIKPLGIPHNGPDTESNIVCLCPNHHLLFDVGAISLADDLTVMGVSPTKLTSKHQIGIEFIRYHREHFGVLIDQLKVAPEK